MKKIFLLLLIIAPFWGIAQSITADPALEPMIITNQDNSPISNTQIPLNGTVRLKLPILNKNASNALPAGSCKIKIGLGSKMVLDPSFNLITANTSNYFFWTSISSGGQVQLTGELTSALPASFSDTAYFDVKGSILGSSTITANFLVTNHNTAVTLSDENGANNNASMGYTIVPSITVPLNLTAFNAGIENCKPNLTWTTVNEVNTNYFDVERGTTGYDWVKIASVRAQGYSSSSFNYSLVDSNLNFKGRVYYRLKMVDRDNSFKYSKILFINNNCSKTQVEIYPNPVINGTMNILINGFVKSCTASLKTLSGEVVATQEIFNGTNAMDVRKLSNGVYIISISDKESFTRQFKVIIQN